MALFGKNKEKPADAAGGDDAPAAPQAFSPEKAQTFFKHARTNHETSNYAYAMQLWLNGLAQDPASQEGFKALQESAVAFINDGGKRSDLRDVMKGLQGKGLIGKYQLALLEWSVRRQDVALSLKATEIAGQLGLTQIVDQLGTWTFQQAKLDKKAKKDQFVKLMAAAEKAGCWKVAVEAGDTARRMDPSDGDLDRKVKEMMAQAAISGGGFEERGEGGFRKNIRDADKQAQLEAQDRISKTEDVKDRIIADTKAELDQRPDDLPTIEKFGRALLDRGTGADLRDAFMLYNATFKKTDEFRWRQRAGEVKIRLIQRKVASTERKVKAKPDDGTLAEELAGLRTQLTQIEVEELRLQIENYPTDLKLKYELGRRLFEGEEFEEAISLFQAAEDDAKLRRTILSLKGKAFLKLGGWEDAAVDTFRQALDGIPDEGSELGMELRYSLMHALLDKAKTSRDLGSAEEADKLAAAIAMKNFGYRDIREKREEIRTILGELRG